MRKIPKNPICHTKGRKSTWEGKRDSEDHTYWETLSEGGEEGEKGKGLKTYTNNHTLRPCKSGMLLSWAEQGDKEVLSFKKFPKKPFHSNYGVSTNEIFLNVGITSWLYKKFWSCRNQRNITSLTKLTYTFNYLILQW